MSMRRGDGRGVQNVRRMRPIAQRAGVKVLGNGGYFGICRTVLGEDPRCLAAAAGRAGGAEGGILHRPPGGMGRVVMISNLRCSRRITNLIFSPGS